MGKNIPYVAVIGGLWQLDKDKAAAAAETGKALGAELAKAGFGLVVYFSSESSLEPHVVAGYSAALEKGSGAIRVRYAESQRGQVRFKDQDVRPDIFEYRLFPGQDWEAPFYRSLAEEEGVDAVLLLAGATSTLIAGQIAIARGLPTLAVDDFGGSAAKIWNQLALAASASGKSYDSWRTKPPEALVAQLKRDCDALAGKRVETRRRELLLTSIVAQREKSSYVVGAFVTLLTALFFGMVYIPHPSAYPFVIFGGLISAGATGALVRLVLSATEGSDPRISLVLGGVAGFVVGLAYLIPQWVGAPGVLSPKVDVVSAVDKIQFASAVLVALSAGVGFDSVFSRLQKQAQDVPIGPPR